jgi:hypothetical protein
MVAILCAAGVAQASPHARHRSSPPAECVTPTTLRVQMEVITAEMESEDDMMKDTIAAVQAGKGNNEALMVRLQEQMTHRQETQLRARTLVMWSYDVLTDADDFLCERIDVPLTS